MRKVGEERVREDRGGKVLREGIKRGDEKGRRGKGLGGLPVGKRGDEGKRRAGGAFRQI